MPLYSKKNISIFIGFILMFILVISVKYFVTTAKSDVEYWDKQLVTDWTTSRHHAFPGLCRMENGNLLVTWCNGTTHWSECHVCGRISTDDGVTWGDTFTIYSGTCQNSDPEVRATSNGTVVCVHHHGTGGCADVSEALYEVSYDNGSTWHNMGRVNPTNGSAYLCTSLKLVGYTLYGTFSDPINGYHSTIMKTTNNGTSWQWHGQVGSANANDEWDFLPLNETHWIAVIRNWPAPSPPDESYQAESFDAGVTWTNITNIYDKIGCQIEDPNLNWLNENERIILLHGRNHSCDACGAQNWSTMYWISTDEGNTWQEQTSVEEYPPSCGGGGGDGGYTSFVSLSDSEGLMVYYNGTKNGMCLLKTIHIAYNVSDESFPQFLSIDGGTNGTIVYKPTPVFNWTIVAGTSQYHLEISTTPTFGSLIVNLTDINEYNYPSNYNENNTRVSFTLPDANQLPVYDTYYCRVRALTNQR